MTGPGKYDAECTLVRQLMGANAVVLCVVNGKYGSGFSVQTLDPAFALILPTMLRSVADQIEEDTRGKRP